MVILESDRIIMRNYRESDLPDYHNLFSDKQNMYYLDDIITNSLEESRKSMIWSISQNDKEQARFFCVELKEINRMIGSCGYEIISETPAGKIGHMGWFIMPEYQNKGYITEAVKKILDFAFLRDSYVRMNTGCYRDNAVTQRVMAKAGFRKEAEKIKAQWHDGQMKDRLEFAINRDEFMQIY